MSSVIHLYNLGLLNREISESLSKENRTNRALPIMLETGTGPKNRLSIELSRLSPIRKT